jgi:hypothetical protein
MLRAVHAKIDLPVANRRHSRLQNLRYAFGLVVT